MGYFYTVFEGFINRDGNAGTQAFVFKEEEGQAPAKDRALSQFHGILAIGAVADTSYHMAMVIRSDGWIERAPEVYDRRGTEE